MIIKSLDSNIPWFLKNLPGLIEAGFMVVLISCFIVLLVFVNNQLLQ